MSTSLLPAAIFAMAVALWLSSDVVAYWIERGEGGRHALPLATDPGSDEQRQLAPEPVAVEPATCDPRLPGR